MCEERVYLEPMGSKEPMRRRNVAGGFLSAVKFEVWTGRKPVCACGAVAQVRRAVVRWCGGAAMVAVGGGKVVSTGVGM